MSRRSGQSGHLEKKGNCWYVRFWQDVPGKEKRAHPSVRLCPISGPGKLTKSERTRKAREIITASGADSAELFNKVQAINLGVTFRQQAESWLAHVQERKRKPVKPATAANWKHCLDKWLNPLLGEMPLSSVDNLAAKELVAKLSNANLGAKSIQNYFQVLKMVVASAVNNQGNQIYPRNWNPEYIDLPLVRNQQTPSFTGEEVSTIVATAESWHRVLYALLAGTGLRIGEALALEIPHLANDCATIQVRQSVWNGQGQFPKTPNAIREIDVPEPLAILLRNFAGGRTQGFLFPSKHTSNILRRNLHPILKSIGKDQRGFHAFRRFRTTWLRKNDVPEDLLRFWLGWSNRHIADGYSKLRDDVEFRRDVCSRIGLGFSIPAEICAENLAVVPSCTQESVVCTI